MCFKTYLNRPINKKTSREKNLRAITVLKKEGGGAARYDHEQRFNGFFLKHSIRKSVKNYENAWNLWRILGTKLVLLVDFWDHIFKTVFPKHFFLFFTLNSKMSRNMRKMRHKVRYGQNLHHESLNFTNYLFWSNFVYNLSYFSTSLTPHYQNNFTKYFFFHSTLQDV